MQCLIPISVGSRPALGGERSLSPNLVHVPRNAQPTNSNNVALNTRYYLVTGTEVNLVVVDAVDPVPVNLVYEPTNPRLKLNLPR